MFPVFLHITPHHPRFTGSLELVHCYFGLVLFVFLLIINCSYQFFILVEICHTTLIDFEECPTLDSSFSSSSQKSSLFGPEKARFSNPDAWQPATDDKDQWVMVDLVIWDFANSVLTKGRSGYGTYVKSFYLEYSMDGISFDYVMEGGSAKASISSPPMYLLISQHHITFPFFTKYDYALDNYIFMY